MPINAEARAESLRLVRQDQNDAGRELLAQIPTEPQTMRSVVDTIKPAHYAALAHVIHGLLQVVQEQPLADTHSPFTKHSTDAFTRLRGDSRYALRQATRRMVHQPSYAAAQSYTSVVGALDGSHYNNLDTQLADGTTTAVAFITTVLRQLPGIIRHHMSEHERRNSSSQEFYGIARRSISLPWRAAMLSVNQLIALRTALSDSVDGSVWDGETILRPEQFKLIRRQDAIFLVTFNDLESVSVPAGFTPHPNIPKLTEATPLTAINCYQPRTIGCPATLISRGMHGLWNWHIDAVEQRQLWDQKTT